MIQRVSSSLSGSSTSKPKRERVNPERERERERDKVSFASKQHKAYGQGHAPDVNIVTALVESRKDKVEKSASAGGNL